MSKKESAEFSCSWKNGIIWGVIALLVAMLAHVGLWYGLMWYQDPDVFQNEVCIQALVFVLVNVLFPVCLGLISYQGYRRIGAIYHKDRNGVSHGRYGKPWIIPLIILVALEVAWLIISNSMLRGGMELSWADPDEQIVLSNFLTISFATMFIDVALYLVGAFIFQPNEIREGRIRETH